MEKTDYAARRDRAAQAFPIIFLPYAACPSDL